MKRVGLLVLFAAGLLVLTPQSPLAEKKGTNRPLWGSLAGAAAFELPPATGCPGGYARVTTLALGNLTHLGLTEARFIHCANRTGTDYVNGVLTLTAANGDELWATYAATAKPFVLVFNGGTGRFENATGTANLDWKVYPVLIPNDGPDFTVPWPWEATIEGSISY